MPGFPIDNRSGLPASEFAELEAIVSRQTSMKHAFDWLLGMTPQVAPADVIAQDEFNHDVLFPFPSGCWLVYDCT